MKHTLSVIVHCLHQDLERQEWFHFNDGVVSQISADQLHRVIGGPETAAAAAAATAAACATAPSVDDKSSGKADTAAVCGKLPTPAPAAKSALAGASSNAYMLVYRRRAESDQPPVLASLASLLPEVRNERRWLLDGCGGSKLVSAAVNCSCSSAASAASVFPLQPSAQPHRVCVCVCVCSRGWRRSEQTTPSTWS